MGLDSQWIGATSMKISILSTTRSLPPEELRHELNGAAMFSKIDMNNAFYQYELDEPSRRLTTFQSPWGLRRCKRMVQGAKPSSAICHEALRRDLQPIRGALNIMDDILVWGCGSTPKEIKKDHDRALKEVFEMFDRNGLTINRKKCCFGTSRIQFFGFVFSPEGIHPDPDKIAALRQAEPPKSKDEVRSFLGMATFNAAYIPRFATISEPLRNLTKKGTRFIWGPEQAKSFKAITSAISESALHNYYDCKKKTGVFTDASPVGLHATLAQMDDQGCWRPVHLASRSLTETEVGYDQLEREAIAMQFAAIRFKQFLAGGKYTHFIDPEPLKAMIEKTKKEAPARVDRVRLKLQGFSFDIQLVKGKHNPADYLSRHPLPHKLCSLEEKRDFADIENHLFVVAHMLPNAITVNRVQQETLNDPVLMKIVNMIKAGVKNLPADCEKCLQPFRSVWNGLSFGQSLLLRGERVVLPSSLTKEALKIAHESHMGIQKTKAYLRNSVWFPRMDQLAEEEVRKCIACSAVTPARTSEPLIMTPLPAEPWEQIAINIFGPLPNGNKILVMKDFRSKWPEVHILPRQQGTNASAVIAAMEKTFATHGIPDIIRSDNGPPFASKAYKNFSEKMGFKAQRVTPLWPRANGQVEAFMKSLAKVCRTSHIEGTDLRTALDKFLLSYRATTHPSTGQSPASLMFPNRRFKTRLPQLPQKPPKGDGAITFNDHAMLKAKQYADQKSHAKEHQLSPGDSVLVRQKKLNKLTPFFNPNPYIVSEVKGSMVTAYRGKHKITRNSSFFKFLPGQPRAARIEKTVQQPVIPVDAPAIVIFPEGPAADSPTEMVPQVENANANTVPPQDVEENGISGEGVEDNQQRRSIFNPPLNMTVKPKAFALPPRMHSQAKSMSQMKRGLRSKSSQR